MPERMIGGSSEASSERVEYSPDVQRVMELQGLWSDSYVNPRPAAEVADLQRRGLLRLGKNTEGEIVASLCEVPLDPSRGDMERGQIYHICGLATSGEKESHRILVRMLGELKEDMQHRGAGILTSTENKVLAKLMRKLGLEEMSPQQLLDRHPESFDFFRADTARRAGAPRERDYYLRQEGEKRFYVYFPQETE